MEESEKQQSIPEEFIPPTQEEDTVIPPIPIAPDALTAKKQRGDDVVLTQCILCITIVLLFLGLHWVKPEWQQWLLQQYQHYRDEPTLAWIDQLLHTVQSWLKQ